MKNIVNFIFFVYNDYRISFMIKKGNLYKRNTDSKTRVQLIRKGNEFFSSGDIESAKKIFLAVDYKDGIVRLGDYYFERKDMEKACEMYFISENPSKIAFFCEKSAKIIEKWLSEDSEEDIIIVEK